MRYYFRRETPKEYDRYSNRIYANDLFYNMDRKNIGTYTPSDTSVPLPYCPLNIILI